MFGNEAYDFRGSSHFLLSKGFVWFKDAARLEQIKLKGDWVRKQLTFDVCLYLPNEIVNLLVSSNFIVFYYLFLLLGNEADNSKLDS
mgnify:CR=1 FL=1